MLVCIDARPLASGHRLRGIGTYTAALIEQLRAAGASGDLHYRYVWPAGTAALPEQLPPGLSDAETRLEVEDGNLSAALRSAGCDVYHATSLDGLVTVPGCATVATLYDLIPLRLPQPMRWLRQPGTYLTYLASLRRLAAVDHILAISAATKADACALLGIAPERISVTLLAADPARAHVPSAEEIQQARTALGLEPPYFLSVASSDPHKNVERLLDAFARFRQRHPSGAAYRLYVMGAWMGRRKQRLHARITRLGLESAVRHLTGVPTRHVAALYSGAQALVFPSLMEGFGLPVLEAMASGTPVIAANGSSLPEITGDAALLVDPYDVEALTEAIWRLAEDAGLRAALIARGQARSRQFSWERLARETVAIYRMAGGGVRVGVQAGGTRALGPYGTA